MNDYRELNDLVRVEDVIAAHGFTFRGRGRYLTCVEHNSLVVDTQINRWTWNSRLEHDPNRDALHWLVHVEGMEMIAARDRLCGMAGVEWDESPQAKERRQATRKRDDLVTLLGDYCHAALIPADLVEKTDLSVDEVAAWWRNVNRTNSATAVEYCVGRGWTIETLIQERVGFWDGDRDALQRWVKLNGYAVDHPIVVSMVGYEGDVSAWAKRYGLVGIHVDWITKGRVTGFWKPCIVYGAWDRNRLLYFSGRDHLTHKQPVMLNPKELLIGSRSLFWNSCSSQRDDDVVVVVEGQADMVTLSQFGIPCVATGGTNINVEMRSALVERLGKYKRVVFWKDADEAGDNVVMGGVFGGLCGELGDKARITENPHDTGKDANDLLKRGGDRDAFVGQITSAIPMAMWLATQYVHTDPLKQDALQKRVIQMCIEMGSVLLSKYRKEIAKGVDLGLTVFDAMVKSGKKEARDKEKQKAARQKREARLAGKETQYTPGRHILNEHGDSYLLEMIYRPPEWEGGDGDDRNTTRFIVRTPDKDYQIRKSIVLNGITYKPLPPTHGLIEKSDPLEPPMMRLADDLIKSPLGQQELHQLCRGVVHQWCDLPEDIEVLAAYYMQMTWLADTFNEVPYLRALGQFGGGKTRFIKTVGNGAFRAFFTTGGASTASLFRAIDMFGMITMVMNEADMKYSDATSELINLINNGHERGFRIARCVESSDEHGNKIQDVKGFRVFGPKLFSMRKPWEDDATNSRCITWETKGGQPDPRIPDSIDHMQRDYWGSQLRNALMMYRLENFDYTKSVDVSGGDRRLPPRLRQITTALRAIAPEIEEEINTFMLKVRRQMLAEASATLQAKVLMGIVFQYYSETREQMGAVEALSMARVARRVNRIIDRENSDGAEEDEDANDKRDKKGVSSIRVGKISRQELNLETDRSGSKRFIVWNDDQITDLCERWGYAEKLAELRKLDEAKMGGG